MGFECIGRERSLEAFIGERWALLHICKALSEQVRVGVGTCDQTCVCRQREVLIAAWRALLACVVGPRG